MPRKQSLPRVDFPGLGEPDVVLTREEVGQLAAELGVSDEQEIDTLLERLTEIASWYEPMQESLDRNTNLPVLRKRLTALRKKAGELLEQINDLDDESRDALTRGIRRCKGPADPRVRHVDPQFVIGAGLTLGVVRDLVDLLADATRCAIEITPSGAGRPSRTPLNQIVLDLALVYEDFSGRKFAREKGRNTWTDAAIWVAKAARKLTPKLTPELTDIALNTALRKAARQRKTEARVRVP